jgi:hypothetical protein
MGISVPDFGPDAAQRSASVGRREQHGDAVEGQVIF